MDGADTDSQIVQDPAADCGMPVQAPWTAVVDKILTGDPTGMEELYSVFAKGIRFFICRQVGPTSS
jgi:hypothetical protein